MENDQEEIPTAPVSVWIGLCLIAAISFWCQAAVTEERFVPALNVLSSEFNIPDDVAGATLMAAGASSPELFSSIVSLFITHSSLGLGTIVGSEIFNQLIICAGAVFAAKSGKLQLDKAIVTREVFFYALGIVLLYLALQDTRPIDGDEEEHIFISFPEACMVFSGYVVYVLVCANMAAVVSFFQGFSSSMSGTPLAASSGGTKMSQGYGSVDYVTQISMHIERMPFLQERETLTHEPVGNFKSVQLFHSSSSSGFDASSSLRNQRASFAGSMREMLAFEFLMHGEKPSDEHALYDVEVNSVCSRQIFVLLHNIPHVANLAHTILPFALRLLWLGTT